MATTDIHHIVGALKPSRSAIKFIATADEAFLIDIFAAARVAANDEAGTFTAWINVPDITGTYGIVSCGDTAAIVVADLLTISMDDETGHAVVVKAA